MYASLFYAASILVVLGSRVPRTAGDSTAGLLEIPDTAALQCKSELLQQPRLARRVQMEIGAPPDRVTRLVRATYDSAGRPLDFTDIVSILDRDHSFTMYSVSGRFVHDTVLGFLVTHRQTWARPQDRFLPTPKDSLRGKYVELAPRDTRRVRALSSWMWAHRCALPRGAASRL